ncbi:MAG: hypothetical protein RSF81_08430, partial [Oscillospiraceae bacterium]
MTVNKKITDGLIKHQMQNIRLSKSEARKSLKVFKEYDKEFLSQLRNLKTVKQKKDFNVLMKEIRRINNNLFDDLLEYTKS